MDKISPCLWFNKNGEEAVNFYVSVFPDSRIDAIMRWPMDGSGPNAGAKKGDVLALDFTLAGQSLKALNGGPQFKFTEAISLSVDCKNQGEVDKIWDALTKDGGKPVQCGWLKDKYGLSWQIVPRRLYELVNDKDTARAARAMAAMMEMVKIDVAAIEKAAQG
jgi:predicted 3-demethylubiquinone-9 3-methyltransferase (glyoxalase superfamily)